jgi:hypothetical protein
MTRSFLTASAWRRDDLRLSFTTRRALVRLQVHPRSATVEDSKQVVAWSGDVTALPLPHSQFSGELDYAFVQFNGRVQIASHRPIKFDRYLLDLRPWGGGPAEAREGPVVFRNQRDRIL